MVNSRHTFFCFTVIRNSPVHRRMACAFSHLILVIKLHIMISSTLDAEAINRAVLPSSFNLVLSKPVKTPEAVVRYTARLRLRLAAQASVIM